MTKRSLQSPGAPGPRWARYDAEFRDPQQVASQWGQVLTIDRELLEHQVRGQWREILARTGVTLVITREYEHLVTTYSARGGREKVSALRLPHPSGLAFDESRRILHVASTRNPNMIFQFAPSAACFGNRTSGHVEREDDVLLPIQAQYYPGSLYLHELHLIDGVLYGNAVGMNAVVRLAPPETTVEPVWWPRSIDGDPPRFDRNYLQLNSMAAAESLQRSFFSASVASPAVRRPGHRNFAVDGRGVIFSGKSRDVVATGLTRPHSARLRHGELWVNNSGYGQVGRIVDHRFESLVRLAGWTRGLCFAGDFAFVGTSRVIPRFRNYAPGLDVDSSECGVHAVNVMTHEVEGSLVWQGGNQVFDVTALPGPTGYTFPFQFKPRTSARAISQLYFRGRR